MPITIPVAEPYLGKLEEEYILDSVKSGWVSSIGKYINLALISGARHGKGYGESIGEMIHNELLILDNERIKIPRLDKKPVATERPLPINNGSIPGRRRNMPILVWEWTSTTPK